MSLFLITGNLYMRTPSTNISITPFSSVPSEVPYIGVKSGFRLATNVFIDFNLAAFIFEDSFFPGRKMMIIDAPLFFR